MRRWPGAVNEAGSACCRSEPTFISLDTPKLESTPAPQGDSTELAEVRDELCQASSGNVIDFPELLDSLGRQSSNGLNKRENPGPAGTWCSVS